ncbi:NAD(P)/FAD-dependent oxidoreductase [Cohnella hashimotonis]|uniref:FAD-dependent oxidoreductase n=1 Tax=Cohnella hashimotonis TaxID=2826895 RepID=A0ABT6TL68_9BACL|nr:FAD-dependent oxidoreductase [Cohnella hashimotonis]MDI4647587.1 FAD-dependent oxidoreductase [Cohnella hashimotonis]
MQPLHFGSLLWPSAGGEPVRYPPLSGTTERCDVLIVGGGLTGTLASSVLNAAGMSVVLIDEGQIGAGSSAASTGLLQYSNDIMLTDLLSQLGDDRGAQYYQACKNAVERLCQLAERLPEDVAFKRRSSLFFASTAADVSKLGTEYETLRAHGFSVDWLNEADIRALFPFDKPAAIVTRGDGELNPYRLAIRLAEQAAGKGARIYEHTALKSVEGPKGDLLCRTSGGGIIRASSVVYAVGYRPEIAGIGGLGVKFARTNAIATRRVPSLADWHQRWLLWETARPYLYARTTPDGRVVIGGFDENIRQPVASRRELDPYANRLLEEARKLFPDLSLEIEFAWNATFCESKDNLPWIGENPDRPGHYVALGYGGNGAVYSMMASEVLLDALQGRANSLDELVGLRNRRTGLPK